MKVRPVFLDPTEFIVHRWHGVKCLSVQITSKCLFVYLFFTSFPLSLPCLLLSLFQPKGRAGGRVCCFSAGDEMRRTVTRGACLSDIHPLTLPPTHWRSDTHAPCHINTYWQEKKDRHTHTAKWQQTHTKLRLKISFLKIKTQLKPKHKKEKKNVCDAGRKVGEYMNLLAAATTAAQYGAVFRMWAGFKTDLAVWGRRSLERTWMKRKERESWNPDFLFHGFFFQTIAVYKETEL